MRYASVCDGIGAAHVAWKPLGWQCSWTSEIEPFPAAVVEAHFGFPNVGDMTKITEEMLDGYGPVDLLVGGTPCQSFSVAGLRGGLADPRGNLALRFVQLAAVMQPKWIVWENVPGVLSSGKGRDFGTFLGALGQLGYGFAYRVLDAQWFGVAQRRRRVFVVGYLGDWRRAAAVLFERESVFGSPPTRGKAWEGVARSTAASLTSSGRGVERCGESRGQDDVVLAAPQVANPLTARMGKGINTTCDEGQTPVVCGIPDPAYAISAGQQGKGGVFGSGRDSQDTFAVVAFHPTQDPISSVDGSTHAMGCGSKGGCCTQAVAFKPGQSEAAGGTFVTEEFAPTLQSTSNGSTAVPAVAFRENQRGEVAYVDPPHALASGGGKPGQGYCGVLQSVAFNAYQRTEGQATWPLGASDGRKVEVGVRQNMAVRRLTPRECERLQGFPDDYTLVEYRKKPAADGPRYRALGNSMAVPVMRWIGQRITMVDGIE
jgi:DNA (cytosine-5)-methyltransferase 1